MSHHLVDFFGFFGPEVDSCHMELLSLTIEGDPVSKARPRFSKQGHTYTDRKTVAAEAQIRKLAKALITEPYEGKVGIALQFYCATRRRTDGDNLQKLVMDALNKVAFVDDYLVEESFWRVHRKAEGEAPRTEIFLYTLDEDRPEPTELS